VCRQTHDFLAELKEQDAAKKTEATVDFLFTTVDTAVSHVIPHPSPSGCICDNRLWLDLLQRRRSVLVQANPDDAAAADNRPAVHHNLIAVRVEFRP